MQKIKAKALIIILYSSVGQDNKRRKVDTGFSRFLDPVCKKLDPAKINLFFFSKNIKIMAKSIKKRNCTRVQLF